VRTFFNGKWFNQEMRIRIADAADRRLDASLLQALSVTNRVILAAPVVPDESRPWSWSKPGAIQFGTHK
jgi:hypothetical protein